MPLPPPMEATPKVPAPLPPMQQQQQPSSNSSPSESPANSSSNEETSGSRQHPMSRDLLPLGHEGSGVHWPPILFVPFQWTRHLLRPALTMPRDPIPSAIWAMLHVSG
ncbi:hypothetical protein FOZ62_001275 [Perkinsus olseni]|uniref:Uncharacterized protein n=1 Tax=Perkinsus olseni TaxID=32597 RepID=A0A7J6NRV7_PEROL|nr:hypothetical protein FOZ62_001275 [Perkinsus olseni]